MVKKIFDLLGREIKGLHEAAYLLAAFALLSQVLGLVRDRLLAGSFGAGESLDIYYAAFRIPDFIFTIIIALVSVSVLVPFLVRVLRAEEEDTQRFIDSVFTGLIWLSVIFSVGAFVLAPAILQALFPELMAAENGLLLLWMTRIMLLQPILLALSGFFTSFIQVFQKFFIYALSPILYNIGIIIGIVVFFPRMGLIGLAWGVVFGALLHLLLQAVTVVKNRVIPRFILRPDMRIIREVLQLSVPRTVAVAGNQIAVIVLISLAGIMVTGSISIFSLAFNLQSVPMAIIGVSYSMAAFPTLARLFANGEKELFLSHIVRAARHIIFWSVPVTVLFVVLRAQIVRTVFGSGLFSWSDTQLVAAALALFSISVVAQSLILLFVRGYYSAGETVRPLLFTIISVIVTVVAAFSFFYLYNSSPFFVAILEDVLRVSGNTGSIVLILPLAFSLGQIINALLLWTSFDRTFKCFSDTLWKSIFHTTAASFMIGVVSYGMLQVLDDVFDLNTLIGIFSQGAVAGIVGIVAGIVTLVLMGNEEIKTVGRTAHSKFWKKTKPIIASEDIRG